MCNYPLWPALKWIGVSVAAALLVISGYSRANVLLDPRFAKSPDWRTRAAYLQVNQQPGDVIVQNYPDPSLGFCHRDVAALLIVPASYLDAARRAETEQTLQGLLRDYRRAWLIPFISPAWDYDGTVERRIARSADRVWRGQIAGLEARLCETPAAFAVRVRRLDIAFACGIQLLGYQVASERAKPGESIQIVLYWRAASNPGADYNVFTHILDAGGVLRAQPDNAPVGGTYPTSQWTPGELVVGTYDVALSPDLPAGSYTIEVGLYDWITQIRLATLPGEDRVILPVTLQIEDR